VLRGALPGTVEALRGFSVPGDKEAVNAFDGVSAEIAQLAPLPASELQNYRVCI
jgi:hypothetical protein